MSAASHAVRGEAAFDRRLFGAWDGALLGTLLALLGLGLVMLYSASLPLAGQGGSGAYYLERQLLYAIAGGLLGWGAMHVPLAWWQKMGPLLLLGVFVLLVAVLVPGLGVSVKGAARWLPLGGFRFQVSEVVKLAMIVWLAGYLVRRGEEVRTQASGFLKPMAVLVLVGGLLLAEPDFGATVIVTGTVLVMMYLAGVQLWKFGVLVALTGLGLLALALTEEYRWRRLTIFRDPWADRLGDGYQIIQSLLAVGQGEWLGQGLGNSILKLRYLPEAHTDFIFAVLAEELGLVGSVVTILLFALLTARILVISGRAMRRGMAFASYLVAGIGVWIGLQAFVNIGVVLGVLPPKGLTLPLMSYGGSSLLVTLVALGVVLRAAREVEGNLPRRPAREEAK